MTLPTAFNFNKILGIKGDKGDVGSVGPQGPSGIGANVYTIDATSATPSKGKVVALKNGIVSELVIVVKTASVTAGPLGVLPSDHVAGDTGVQVAVSGTLPNSVTQLGNSTDGLPHDVMVTATGSLAYAYVPSGGETIIGHSPGDGRLTIDKRVSNVSAPVHTYNPITYGALADGVHDDTAAWNAMMNAIPQGQAAAIDIPLGRRLYLAGDAWAHGVRIVRVKRYVHIRGNGGGVAAVPTPNTCGFTLAPLCSMVFDYSSTSDDGGTSSLSRLEKVDVYAKTPIVSDAFGAAVYNTLSPGVDFRTAGVYVAPGQCMVYSGATVTASNTSKTDITLGGQSHTEIMFRAVGGGTPTGSAPASFATATVANIGNTIADTSVEGTLSWVVEGVPKDYRASTAYVVGQRVWCPGDSRYIYECTVAGTTSNSATHYTDTNFVQPQLWATFVDGTVTWRVIVASPILVFSSNVLIRDVTIVGGFGFGVLVAGEALDGTHNSSANFCDLQNLYVSYAGGGAHFHGLDANAHTVTNLRYFGSSTHQRSFAPAPDDVRMGTGEICGWDRAQSGGKWSGCYSQFGYGPGYVCDNAAGGTKVASPAASAGSPGSVFVLCQSENSLADIMYGSCTKIGEGNQSEQADATAMTLTYNRTRNIQGSEIDASAKTTAYRLQTGSPGSYSGAYGMQAGNDAAGGFWHQWWTDHVSTTLLKTGVFAFGSQPTPVTGIPRVAFGVTYADAKNTGSGPGPGLDLLYLYDGYFSRADASFHGTDATMLTSARLRYGLRKVGDTFPIPGATGAVGTFRRCAVSAQGYRGTQWTAGTTYYAEDDAAGHLQEALLVEPSTAPAVFTTGATRVWKYTGALSNNGVEPIWPASGNFTDAHGNTWVDMGVSAVVVPTDYVDDPIVAFTSDVETNWANLARSKVQQLKVINDATTKVAATYALPNNATTAVDCVVVMKQSAGTGSPDGARFVLTGCWYRDGGGAPVQVGAPAVTRSEPNANGTAWTSVLALNGNNVEVHTTTDAAKTVTVTVVRQGVEGVQL